MKLAEYEKFKEHILEYIEIKDLKADLEAYSKQRGLDSTYFRAKQMVQDGFFECYYQGVMEALEGIYGDDFKRETYENKDGYLKWKNDECYCWTVYKHKVALTIETMEKKGLLK